MQLNQVTLPVNDIEAAKKFYLTLGFDLIVDTPHYLRFGCPMGNSSFSLSLSEEPFCNGAIIYFEHPELDEWVVELKRRGIEFIQEPQMQTYLWREAVLLDPSNNKIKLFWAGENRLNPPWKVTA